MTSPDIMESALEHRIQFQGHWVDKWIIPNPFIPLLFSALSSTEVALEDFAFRQDAKNVAETALVVTVDKLNTTINLGVDRITFRINNPDWEMAPQIVELFDKIVEAVTSFVSAPIKSQEITLVFHVSPGNLDFGKKTAELVNSRRLGAADFYGISVASAERSLLIEASKKIVGGAFYRLTRTFRHDERFAEIALALHADEVSALRLLDVEGVI